MARVRRSFSRPIGKRRYRRLFIIATEGAKTEPQYFGIFNDEQTTIQIKMLKGRRQSAPLQVLARLKKYLKEEGLRKNDEAWLVIDRDQWTEAQLGQLNQWSLEDEKYGMAVSNPKFEFWLLLHFEDGTAVNSSYSCERRLIRHMPHFGKGHVEVRKLKPHIGTAVERARLRDRPPCSDWPRNFGTTVYKLVEKLI